MPICYPWNLSFQMYIWSSCKRHRQRRCTFSFPCQRWGNLMLFVLIHFTYLMNPVCLLYFLICYSRWVPSCLTLRRSVCWPQHHNVSLRADSVSGAVKSQRCHKKCWEFYYSCSIFLHPESLMPSLLSFSAHTKAVQTFWYHWCVFHSVIVWALAAEKHEAAFPHGTRGRRLLSSRWMRQQAAAAFSTSTSAAPLFPVAQAQRTGNGKQRSGRPGLLAVLGFSAPPGPGVVQTLSVNTAVSRHPTLLRTTPGCWRSLPFPHSWGGWEDLACSPQSFPVSAAISLPALRRSAEAAQ